MAKDLTRRELFDLVWGRPMTKVAADLGISDVALHKICDKHRIPAPGRGYWAKVAAGGKPPKGHFREISNSGLNLVRIYGSPLQALPEPVREARAKAMAMASAPPVVVEPTPTPDLHPAAERLKHFLAKGKPNAAGFIDISDAKTF
ncbi:hypothetical protein, partial [Paludibacterium sp.]|uniref:hypothetical protein n=1 Tax=Paludibacterium sp. TaxID=1917523 RepID=UPI0025CD1441